MTQNLNLIAKVNEIKDNISIFFTFKDVFDNGLGKFPFTYDIKLESISTPKVSSARVIPKALNEIVKAEIEQMV